MAAVFRSRVKPDALVGGEDPPPFSVLLADGFSVTCRLKRSARRRRTIAIHMGADGTLTVAAPVRTSPMQVQAFLSAHQHWLQRIIARHQSIGLPSSYAESAVLPYLGFKCQLVLREGRAGCAFRSRRFIVTLPDLTAHRDVREQMTKLELRLWLKRRARQKLAARLALWAQRLEIQVNGIEISDARRRWGSCSASNEIRLNWRLIMAPLNVIDYVCVHELCHVRHKNHGPKFWEEVARAMPNFAACERELKQRGGLLTAL